MDNATRASIAKKIRNMNMIYICIVGSISVLGFVMAVYSIFKLKLLFTLIYLIAVILGFSYVVMKINTIIPTYIENDKKYLYLQNWDNGLFPFRTDNGILGEFMPSKTVIKKVDIKGITKIYYGSKNYLLKLVDGGNFRDTIVKNQEKYNALLKKMDFLYINTKNNDEVFMSVTEFDKQELVDVIKPIIEKNEKIDFKCSDRFISKKIPVKKKIIE